MSRHDIRFLRLWGEAGNLSASGRLGIGSGLRSDPAVDFFTPLYSVLGPPWVLLVGK